MKSPEYRDIKRVKRVGIVEEELAYPCSYKRYKALAPWLAETLKAMKADGTFQQLTESR